MKAKRFFSVTLLMSIFLTLSFSVKATSCTALFTENLTLHDAAEMNASANRINFQDRPGRFGETPEDSIHCVRNLSLYQEYYNQGNRQLAWEPWREVFFNCPQASMNTFIRGAILVKMQYAQETDPIKRDAWVDTLMMVYDQRIEYFGHDPRSREGLVLGRKAVDLFQLRPNNVMEILELTERSIELEGNQSQADVLLIFMQSLIRMVEAGVKEETEILEAYDMIMDIIEHNLEHNPGDRRFFEPAKANIEIMFEPFASCENIITLFGPRYERNPEDIELLEQITDMLNRAGCTDSELYYNATLSLHRLKPTAQSAFLMGRMENTSQNYREAIGYFEQSVQLYDADQDKFTALMLMADISFRQLRQYREARAYALRASEKDPQNGRPFILIGEMYAATASQCGDNDLTKNVAYWAAVDKFNHARNIDDDPVVQERATQLINTFSQYFPNNEVIFFYGLSIGDTYRVECWINETTRVRAR